MSISAAVFALLCGVALLLAALAARLAAGAEHDVLSGHALLCREQLRHCRRLPVRLPDIFSQDSAERHSPPGWPVLLACLPDGLVLRHGAWLGPMLCAVGLGVLYVLLLCLGFPVSAAFAALLWPALAPLHAPQPSRGGLWNDTAFSPLYDAPAWLVFILTAVTVVPACAAAVLGVWWLWIPALLGGCFLLLSALTASLCCFAGLLIAAAVTGIWELALLLPLLAVLCAAASAGFYARLWRAWARRVGACRAARQAPVAQNRADSAVVPEKPAMPDMAAVPDISGDSPAPPAFPDTDMNATPGICPDASLTAAADSTPNAVQGAALSTPPDTSWKTSPNAALLAASAVGTISDRPGATGHTSRPALSEQASEQAPEQASEQAPSTAGSGLSGKTLLREVFEYADMLAPLGIVVFLTCAAGAHNTGLSPYTARYMILLFPLAVFGLACACIALAARAFGQGNAFFANARMLSLVGTIPCLAGLWAVGGGWPLWLAAAISLTACLRALRCMLVCSARRLFASFPAGRQAAVEPVLAAARRNAAWETMFAVITDIRPEHVLTLPLPLADAVAWRCRVRVFWSGPGGRGLPAEATVLPGAMPGAVPSAMPDAVADAMAGKATGTGAAPAMALDSILALCRKYAVSHLLVDSSCCAVSGLEACAPVAAAGSFGLWDVAALPRGGEEGASGAVPGRGSAAADTPPESSLGISTGSPADTLAGSADSLPEEKAEHSGLTTGNSVCCVAVSAPFVMVSGESLAAGPIPAHAPEQPEAEAAELAGE